MTTPRNKERPIRDGAVGPWRSSLGTSAMALLSSAGGSRKPSRGRRRPKPGASQPASRTDAEGRLSRRARKDKLCLASSLTSSEPVASRSPLQWWQAALTRVGVHTPFGRDAVGAALLVGLGLLLSLGSPLPTDRPALQVLHLALALASAGALAWRRRAPTTVFAVTLLSPLGGMLLATPLIVSPLAAVAAYSVGAYCRQRHAVVAIATGTAVVALVGVGVWRVLPWAPLVEAPLPAASLSWVSVLTPALLTIAVPALLGAHVRSRRAHTAALEQRARDLEREREERARRAVAEERGRIAREVHDVAAHRLSELVIRAGAAERQATDHPDAQQALVEIRQQARATLAELRQVLEALHDEEEGGEREPPPSPVRADRLVDDARRAGCDVSLTVEGDQGQAVPASVDRAAYRVLQEALVNQCRHAPGTAVIARLRYTSEALEVEVANPGPARPASTLEDGCGCGLAGARERVALAGGALTVAPTPEGGCRVHATLPITLTPAG